MAINIRHQIPKNETKEHLLLKNVAVAYLRLHFNCTIAASEVSGLRGPLAGREIKSVADAAGIRIKDQWLPVQDRDDRDNPYKRIKTVYCIEVKVSKNDFFAGYCTGGDLNYVMTPKGLLDKGDLHKGIGLLEVDLNELAFTTPNYWVLKGIQVTKRATSTKTRENNDAWVDELFREMAKRITLENIRNNPWFYPGYPKMAEDGD